MTFLERLCQAFDQTQLHYAIVGGYAVALHGAVRGTVDIDCVLNWNLESLKRAETALLTIGLQPRLPINAEDVFNFRDEYIQKRNLIAWSFYNPNDLSEQLDILINFDLKRKQTLDFKIGPHVIKVLNKQDLIEMKRKAARPQDLADISALEQLP